MQSKAKQQKSLSTFKKFLKMFAQSDTLTGDIARDILRDSEFLLNSLDRQIEYLNLRKASSNCIHELPRINKLYEQWLNNEAIAEHGYEVRSKYYSRLLSQVQYRPDLWKKSTPEILIPFYVPKYYGCNDHAILRVDHHSPFLYRRAVENYAYMFKRQFGYDFVQFTADESWGSIVDRVHKQSTWYSYLFLDPFDTSNMYKTVGGCTFRWREYKNHESGWALQWIWIHPFHQRQGILSQHWGGLNKMYGQFAVESPLSPAMTSFLDQHPLQSQPTCKGQLTVQSIANKKDLHREINLAEISHILWAHHIADFAHPALLDIIKRNPLFRPHSLSDCQFIWNPQP